MKLTDRQLRALNYMCQGLRDKETALMMGCSEKAVRHLIAEACKKKGCRGRVQLAAWWVTR